MREILFRGQCEATNEWVYGLPVTETTLSNTISHIAQYSGKERKFGRTNVKIKPETIGQFTGLLDKSGNKIFENDRVLYDGVLGNVFYNKDLAMFMVRFDYTNYVYNFDNLDREIEIIGNIHEENK